MPVWVQISLVVYGVTIGVLLATAWWRDRNDGRPSHDEDEPVGEWADFVARRRSHRQ